MPENGSINEGTTGTPGTTKPTGGGAATYGTGGSTTGTGAALSQQAQHYGEKYRKSLRRRRIMSVTRFLSSATNSKTCRMLI